MPERSSNPLLPQRDRNCTTTEEFYLSLISGEGLTRDMPVLTLRNFIIDQNIKGATRGSGGERLQFVDAILTCLYAHLKGEKMSRISARADAVEYFRKPQADSIAKTDGIFPPICEGSIQEALVACGGGRLICENETTTARG